MKQLQFAVQVFLLIVGMFAVSCYWRYCLDEPARMDREFQRMNLETSLSMYQRSRAQHVQYQNQADPNDPRMLAILDKAILETKTKLAALKP